MIPNMIPVIEEQLREKDKEIERLNTDKEQLTSLVNSCQEEIRKLKSQLQQKENKEKEIREYIMTELITEWDIKNAGHVSGSDLPVDAITPILEILDKGNDKK